MMVLEIPRGEPTDTSEQRAHCMRFCATVILILSTLFVVRVQQERYIQLYARSRHHTPKGRDPSPDVLSVDVMYIHPGLNRSAWVRGTAGSGSLLLAPFVASLPKGFGMLTGQTDVSDAEDRVRHEPESAPEISEEVDEIIASVPSSLWADIPSLRSLRLSVPRNSAWLVEANAVWGATTPVSITTSLPVGGNDLSGVVAAYRDTRLFRRRSFPGCANTATIRHCFITLVHLPLVYCSAASSSGSLYPSLPWTCSRVLSETSVANHAKLVHLGRGPSCIRVVTGANLVAIAEYVASAMVADSQPAAQYRSAGVVTQFCGNPLKQLLAVDVVGSRIFFVQVQDEEGTRRQSGRRLSAATLNSGVHLPTKVHPAARIHQKKLWKLPGFVHFDQTPGDKNMNDGGATSLRKLGYDQSVFHTLCVTQVVLDGFYDEVSQCVPLRLEPDITVRPVHMAYDIATDTIILFNRDKKNQLVVSSFNSTAIQPKLVARFEGLQIGRVISTDFSTLGKLVVAGEEHPYRDFVDVIDLQTGSHERMHVSAYMH